MVALDGTSGTYVRRWMECTLLLAVMYVYDCTDCDTMIADHAHPSLLLQSQFLFQPDGGVSMNESFRAKVLHKTNVARAELDSTSLLTPKSDPNQSTSKRRVQFDIPTGRWRDGIFDCCIMPFHPIVFLTYCWPLITLGQVMTRIQFKICGGRDNQSQFCPRAFYVMLTITIINTVIQLMFSGIGQLVALAFTFNNAMFGMGNNLNAATAYNPYANSNAGSFTFNDDALTAMMNGTTTFSDDAFTKIMNQQISNQVSTSTSGSSVASVMGIGVFQFMVMLGLLIFIMVVHTKTRNRIRRAYSIGNDMSCLGDCCCAFWCGICSICQMARHTANYHNTHRARCCTPTGLDEEWDDYDFLTVDPYDDSQRSTTPMVV
jgi:Cys-rich protein (TIGR01571 family)